MIAPRLKRVQRLDAVPVGMAEWTDEGYFFDTPILTSTGIFEYTNPDGSERRELRLPEYVFDKKSLATYEGKPVIITHEAEEVNKDNVKDEIIGTILSKGFRDGDDVRAKIIIHDTDAMRESGLHELSLGYDLTLDETPGEWNGEPYDAIQHDIEINHLALVGNARAGEQARLNIDGTTTLKGGKKSMSAVAKNKTRKDGGPMDSKQLKETISAFKKRRDERITVDFGEPEEEKVALEGDGPEPEEPTEENEAQATTPEDRIQMVKDRRDRRDSEGDPKDPNEAMGVIAQQDEDIDTLLEIIEELAAKNDYDSAEKCDEDDDEGDEEKEKENDDESDDESKSMNADSVDRLVTQRLRFARIGDKLNLDGLENMKPIDAQKAIIRKIKPQMRLDGKSKAYINVAFDLAVGEMNAKKDTNYQRKQMTNFDGSKRYRQNKTSATRSREEMIKRQNGGEE